MKKITSPFHKILKQASGLLFFACLSAGGFAQVNHVVISQVYGGGGNAGSVYKNDFVELYNPTSSPVSLTGWSVQYASVAGSFTTTASTALSGVIQPGGYYLVQEAVGAGGTTNLPTPDATGTISMSSAGFKIALVSSGSVTGSCPTATTIVDFVGVGTANCFEGAAAPAPGNTTSALRLYGGCIDTDQNNADFTVGTLSTTGAFTPHNSASATHCCTLSDVSAAALSGTVSAAFSYSLSATNTATSYAVSSGTLPAGLSLNASTGIISGSPTASGTSTVNIAATNACFTGAPATLTFVVSPANAAPVFTGGASQTFTVCENASGSINALLQITDADNGQTETWSVLSAPANGSVTAGTTKTSNGGSVTPAGFTYMPNALYSGTDVFSVQVDDGNGGTATTTVTVTINALPAVSVNSASICAGGTATLTATGANTYTWSTSETGATINPSPSTGTGYTVTGTDLNNCTAMATSSVTVNALPVISASSATICAGKTATLTAGGAMTYTWNGSVSGASITPSPTVTTDFTVVGTDANNCTGTATSTVLVNDPPMVSVNSATICAGGTATLTATGAANYLWNNLQSSATITVSPGSTSTFTVTGTDANSCKRKVSSTVIVNDLPIVSINAPAICAGSTATLTASGAGNYTWSTSEAGPVINPSPAANTDYTVTGTDANNCTNTATATLTVNTLPSVSVNSATVCAGSTATLTATGANTYAWSTSETGATINPSPSADMGYTVTGTDVNSCVGTATGTVTVNALPVVSASSATICSGKTATLTASGAMTYTWNGSVSGASITPSPTVTTDFTVVGTDANNCTGTAISTVLVNDRPVLSVNSPTICLGGTATLTATGAVNYLWNTLQSSASISVSPGSTTAFTVTGTDANNCKSKVVSTVIVNDLPIVSINAPAICAGGTATLTASGAGNYTWSTSESGPVINPSPTISTDYTVTGTDANNCTNTATATLTVNTLPSVSVNSATVCAGSTATLTAGGADTYSWSTSETGATINPSPSTATDYTVTGTDVNNCINTATATIAVNALPSVSVNSATVCAGSTATLTATGANTYVWSTSETGATINPSPSTATDYTVTGTDLNNCMITAVGQVSVNALPSVAVNSAPLCAGGMATLTATGADTYTWSTSETSSSVTPSPAMTSTYAVTGTDLNNCTATAISTVTVNDLPTVSATSNTVSLCAGSTATLTAAGADTYTWSTAETGASISVSPASTATYTFTGTDANGCINTGTITQSVMVCTVTGLAQLSANNALVVYPNPSQGIFTIDLSGGADAMCALYDVNGKLVLSQLISGKAEINAAALQNGVYNLSIVSHEGTVNRRIIIAR